MRGSVADASTERTFIALFRGVLSFELSDTDAIVGTLAGNQPLLRVLMVDDEVLRQRTIKRIFRVRRCEVEWTCETTSGGAIAAIDREPFDRFLIEVRLAGHVCGLDVLRHARDKHLATAAIVYGAGLDRPTSLAARRLGACRLECDAATEDLVDAILDPPFGAYGSFSETDAHGPFEGFRLSDFAQVLAARNGNVHAAAQALLIPQQTAQCLFELLQAREARFGTTAR